MIPPRFNVTFNGERYKWRDDNTLFTICFVMLACLFVCYVIHCLGHKP